MCSRRCLSAEIEVGGGFFAVTVSEGVADCHVTSSTRGVSTPCAHTGALSAVIEGGGGFFAGTASEGVADCHVSTRGVSTPCAHAGALSADIEGGGVFFCWDSELRRSRISLHESKYSCEHSRRRFSREHEREHSCKRRFSLERERVHKGKHSSRR